MHILINSTNFVNIKATDASNKPINILIKNNVNYYEECYNQSEVIQLTVVDSKATREKLVWVSCTVHQDIILKRENVRCIKN